MTAATFENTCPEDAIGRPVRIRASGFTAWVTAIDPTTRFLATVQSMAGDVPWDLPDRIAQGDTQPIFGMLLIGEPIQIDLMQTDPVCIDCCEPLEASPGLYPGVCVNSSCFLFEKP